MTVHALDQDRVLELGTDVDPLLGDEGPSRHFGRLAASLDAVRHRVALRNAMASAALLPGADGVVPIRRGVQRNEVGEALRDAIVAARRAPLSLWRVTGPPSACRLVDLVGLGPTSAPDGPVAVWGEVGRIGPSAPVWAARCLRDRAGAWWAVWPLALPEGARPDDAIRRWREHHPDVLAALLQGGDRLCRDAFASAWAASG